VFREEVVLFGGWNRHFEYLANHYANLESSIESLLESFHDLRFRLVDSHFIELKYLDFFFHNIYIIYEQQNEGLAVAKWRHGGAAEQLAEQHPASPRGDQRHG
jgi:hypothetical protein